MNQFSIITELLGTPPEDVIQTICSENVSKAQRAALRPVLIRSLLQTLRFVQSLPKRERIPFSQRFRGVDPAALDLLEKMLVFDPRKRITATEALAHEYLAPYHDPSDEPEAPEPFDWSFNDADLPVDTWKVMMYSEILQCVHFALANVRQADLFACRFHNVEGEAEASGPVAGTGGATAEQVQEAQATSA